jgi:ribosomal protein S18 acetylase RimI-like enzyme
MAIADVAAPLGQGFHALAPGDLAAVVTALEMREPPASLKRLVPEADAAATGALESGRAGEIPPALSPRRRQVAVVVAPRHGRRRARRDHPRSDVELYAVADRAGVEVGMLELDFRTGGQAEIAFFGLIPGATGKGFGKWLMRRALQRAWGGKA